MHETIACCASTLSCFKESYMPRANISEGWLKINAKPVKSEVAARVVGFVVLYLLLCLAGALALALTGIDPLTAIGGSIASVGNVGPSFAGLGPTDNYGWMTSPGLGVLTFLMLVGRLEIYTVVLLFHPEVWRARRAFH